MKKLFSMVLTIAVILSLIACGGGKTTLRNADVLEYSSKAGEEMELVPFEEITVVDNAQCAIKITAIDPDNIWGYTLKAYFENKSADKTYMFSVTGAAVNGVESDPFFATEVAAGKKAIEEISFSDDLSSHGIGAFTDIEISFRVYDSDDWFADAAAEETVHVYPYGEQNATVFVREAQATDTVVADNDNVSVIVTGYDEDEFWGYTVYLYLVNKTDTELMYSVDNVSINGFMADPFWAASVGAGKAAFTTISWFDSDLEEKGITTVEEIEMNFRIYESENWFADDIFNEVITLKP